MGMVDSIQSDVHSTPGLEGRGIFQGFDAYDKHVKKPNHWTPLWEAFRGAYATGLEGPLALTTTGPVPR